MKYSRVLRTARGELKQEELVRQMNVLQDESAQAITALEEKVRKLEAALRLAHGG